VHMHSLYALSLYGTDCLLILCYLPISNNLKWQLIKIEFKNSSRYAIFSYLCLYFVSYTHCFLVCLLHYVCDFIYTCFISCSLLAGLKWHVPDCAISSHSFAIAACLPCSMWTVKCLNKYTG